MDLPSEMLAWSGRCLCFGRPRWQWPQLFSLGSGEERRLIFWTAAGNRAYEGSYFIPSFVLFFSSDWAGKRSPPLLVLYICHRNSMLHSLFFCRRATLPPPPFPPLLVKIEESRVTTKKGWVAAVSPRKDRIIIRFWETAFLPHP